MVAFNLAQSKSEIRTGPSRLAQGYGNFMKKANACDEISGGEPEWNCHLQVFADDQDPVEGLIAICNIPY
jgi:hypothetical protein